MNPLFIYVGAYLFAGIIGGLIVWTVYHFAVLPDLARRNYGVTVAQFHGEAAKARMIAKSEGFKLGMKAQQKHYERTHVKALFCLACMAEIKEHDNTTAFRTVRAKTENQN